MKIPRSRLMGVIAISAGLLVPAVASAHVVVTPKQAGVAEELPFNVSVPNERDTAVTAVKLLIPSGVSNVIPTEKSGWTIQTKTTGSDQAITEIDWSGSMPVGERDDFSFSAQAPSHQTTLNWKAYQTYADGTVVHWDQKPVGDQDDATGNAGPYSRTQIVNDLSSAQPSSRNNQDRIALGLAVAALLLSLIAILRRPKATP